MTVKKELLKPHIQTLFPGKKLQFLSNHKLHNYRDKSNVPMPLVVYNALHEPVLIADYSPQHTAVTRYYPTISFILDLSDSSLLNTKTGQKSIITLQKQNKPASSSFWLLFTMLCIAALVIFILVSL